MSKPISVNDIANAKNNSIPDVVFDAFNALILKNWNGGSATVGQDEVIRVILASSGYSRAEIFDSHWLDVEGAYRDEGWVVEYDKPGYNESYEAYFVFRKPRNKV